MLVILFREKKQFQFVDLCIIIDVLVNHNQINHFFHFLFRNSKKIGFLKKRITLLETINN